MISSNLKKFRENIESFSYVEAESDDDRAAYFLQFAPVNNSDVNAAFSDDKPTAQAAQQKYRKRMMLQPEIMAIMKCLHRFDGGNCRQFIQ